ncbi:cation:proton antiporter domain-containing protein [Catelliglobosispora koreensis]|uniref:cation:proton antiporter domain-containing protein n=1 Tax=Catelliglobosispora koreensis TaxID=129052 RepID=UPI00037EAC45|nr:cation:proton antiporter [Catelliglobosispora koreensis]
MTMWRIGQLLVFILLGLGLARLLSVDVTAVSHSPWYQYGAFLLLGIGLYGATNGIDLRQAKQDKKIIVLAVTVGVVLKALIIGGSLALFWDDPLFLILGVAVAQIDPLSVAALMGDGRLSTRARTVLAAWSSFDDPFTVVLSIYAAAVAVNTFGLGSGVPTGTSPALLYAWDLAGNIALALVAWLIWRLEAVQDRAWLQYLLLLAFLAVSVVFGLMLGIAIIGLFARPQKLEPLIPRITTAAMFLAAIVLGFLLIDGIEFGKGIALGAMAYLAQAIVAVPLARKFPPLDRWHLAAAQQNGITAIILALALEIQFDGVVAVVAPAIITANVLHFVVNKVIDLNERKLAGVAGS